MTAIVIGTGRADVIEDAPQTDRGNAMTNMDFARRLAFGFLAGTAIVLSMPLFHI